MIRGETASGASSIGECPTAGTMIGPKLTVETTLKLIGERGAFAPDITARINHPLSQRVFANRGGTLPRLWPEVDARDVEAGYVYETDNFRVTNAPARHVQPYLDSLAWRVETEDCSIVFTGDTQPCDSVRDLALGADVLVSMCWDHQDQMARDHEDIGQTGTVGAAQMAEQAGVSNLVLVHNGPDLALPGSIERGIGDIHDTYRGNVYFGRELLALPFGGSSIDR